MFHLTKEEQEKIRAFQNEQEKLTGGHYGTIGGGYTYHFTPTSLGVVVRIENNVTKAVLDITDYENW